MSNFSFDLALVTGAAGFIGSHLSERLVNGGCRVRGIDCFTSYYPPAWKRHNLQTLLTSDRFKLREVDLRTDDLKEHLDGVDVIFHQAAQPGVRASWSEGFVLYDAHNILATQRLLEAARQHQLRRFVYASSSSVYGEAPKYPTTEADVPRPHSPYGVTKLAAEHLCTLFAANWGLPTVSLRYFTVYGPRQRPDMAIHRLMEAGLRETAFPLYGSGEQMRDFTHVFDVVEANVLAAEGETAAGDVFNIAGGSTVTMNELIKLVEGLLGAGVAIDRFPVQVGDVRRTGGSVTRARDVLEWKPAVALSDGLRTQLEWHRSRVLA